MTNTNLLILCNMIRLVHSTESDHVKKHARKSGIRALTYWVCLGGY